MPKYDQIHENEWIIPVMKGYRMACCDCGLVHELDFKVILAKVKKHDIDEVLYDDHVKAPKGLKFRIQLRARRNSRRTAQLRRWRHKKENK